MEKKSLFRIDNTYEQMKTTYKTSDGIIAIIFYIIIILLYLLMGFLYSEKNIYIVEYMSAFLILVCISIVLIRKQNIASIGLTLRNIGKSALFGLKTGLFLMALTVIPSIRAGKSLIGMGNIVYNLYFYFIIIGFCEEIVFRGFIQTRLYGLIKSDIIASIVCASMFGLMHIPFQMQIRNMSLISFIMNNYLMILIPFFWHFVLNFLYRKFNSLLAPTILHGFMNFSSNLFF